MNINNNNNDSININNIHTVTTAKTYYNNTNTRDGLVLILYLVTAIVAVIGNLFICVTIYRRKRLSTMSNTYVLIFNMAISDILGGLMIPGQWLFCSSIILDQTAWWFGSVGCNLMVSLQLISYYGSSLTMTAMAFDRYMLVCRPMSSRPNIRLLVITIWTVGIVCVAPNVAINRVFEYFSPTKVKIFFQQFFN